MSGRLSDYVFDLPERLIAQRPSERRGESRMMVVERATGKIAHRRFADFPEYLRAGDLVVLNDTRVRKARCFSDDGRIEVFFLTPLGDGRWECLVRPGKRMRRGMRCLVGGVNVVVEDVLEDGRRIVRVNGEVDFERWGRVPLPPYIDREADEEDVTRYQTVFAREEGSVAAPTAGLHFSEEILQRIPHAFLTLHVGLGTFKPIECEDLDQHRMHAEAYAIPEETARKINEAGRIVAVGSTTVRVLESQPERPITARAGVTDIFIRPPYRFRNVGAMLTNFHLPRSSLLVMVSALAGVELIREAYAEAVKREYRFFSYGDCMLIL